MRESKNNEYQKTRVAGGCEKTVVDHDSLCWSSSGDGSGRSQFLDLGDAEIKQEGEGDRGQGAEANVGRGGSYNRPVAPAAQGRE
jgi:hypothetical protein